MTDRKDEKNTQPIEEPVENIDEQAEDESHEEEETSRKNRKFLGSRDSGLSKKELKLLRKELESNEEKVKQLEKELEESKSKASEFEDRFLRLNAEFENFRKRKAREVSESIKYATEALIIEVLPSLNNFETALTAAEKSPETKNWAIGMEMIFKQLMDVFKSKGVEEINPEDEAFDPSLHSAVETVETEEHPDHHVIEVLQKGYKLHDRVVQPASVKVAVSPTKGNHSAAGETGGNRQAEIKVPVEDKDGIDNENK